MLRLRATPPCRQSELNPVSICMYPWAKPPVLARHEPYRPPSPGRDPQVKLPWLDRRIKSRRSAARDAVTCRVRDFLRRIRGCERVVYLVCMLLSRAAWQIFRRRTAAALPVGYPGVRTSLRAVERADVWETYLKTRRFVIGQGKPATLVIQTPERPRSITIFLFDSRQGNGDIPVVDRAGGWSGPDACAPGLRRSRLRWA